MAGLSALGGNQVDLMALINVMADPEAFREKVKELTELRNQLNERIAAVGKIEQLEAILEEANQTRLEANQLLEDVKASTALELANGQKQVALELERARQEAAQLSVQAQERANQIILAAKEQERAIIGQHNKRDDELGKFANEIELDKANLIKRTQDLDRKGQQLNDLEARLLMEEDELSKAKERYLDDYEAFRYRKLVHDQAWKDFLAAIE